MVRFANERPAWGALGPDPGPGIRIMVALLLRVGVGLSLLNAGLAGYLNVRGAIAIPGTGPGSLGGLDPLMSALPYLSIGLGLALILGFLTTPTAVAAGFFSLVTPLLGMVTIVSAGMTGGNPAGWPGGGNPFQQMMMMMGTSSYLTGLIPAAALIWLSPLENHPYSVDALIFGRNAVEITPPRGEVVAGTIEPPATDEPVAVAGRSDGGNG